MLEYWNLSFGRGTVGLTPPGGQQVYQNGCNLIRRVCWLNQRSFSANYISYRIVELVKNLKVFC